MLNSRLDLLQDYPFRRLAALLSAPPGDDVIAMAVGEPQHEAPPMVAEILAHDAALWGRYPPVPGTQDFREAAARWLERRFGLGQGTLDWERQVLSIPGSKEGLFLVGMMAVGPRPDGKTPAVLLPNPFYQVYAGTAVLAGAEPIFVAATKETGFLPDFTTLPEEVLERTALAIYCSPSNPQGAVATLDQLKEVVALARRYDFVLASDECYSEVYDGEPPAGVLTAAMALGGLDNVMAFHSLSKRSSVPGMRSGFVAGDAALMKAFGEVRNYCGTAVPLPVQAASAALLRDEAHVESSRALYRAKFDMAERMLGGRFGFYRPAGAFYLWLDVGDGEAAAKRLWERAGVRVLPGGYMTRPEADGRNVGAPYIRVALVHDLDTTRRALTRIAETLDGMPAEPRAEGGGR